MRYLFESTTAKKKPTPTSMASGIASKVLEIRKDSIKHSMEYLDTMPHRQQYVDTIDDVIYYDDARAENVNATWFTFENIVNPVVWIVGGSCHNNYSELIENAKKNVRAIISLGSEKENIEMTFKGIVSEIHQADSIAEAVEMASIIAEKKEIVLFSPACKDDSLDYNERAKQFIAGVKKLTETH